MIARFYKNSFFIRSICNYKPQWTKQNAQFWLCVLSNRKSIFSSRGLTTESTKEEARQKAVDAFKVWTKSGLGNRGCVDGYSNSGKTYEEHMDALDFTGPYKMAEITASILKQNKDVRILDACAGSGLGGVALRHFGYNNVDAVDASQELLKLAEAKGVYCNIISHFLGNKPLPLENGTYDMVVLSGAVGENHIPASAFGDLIRVVRQGGHIVNVYREAAGRVPWYGDGGLESYFDRLEKLGKWKRLDRILFPNFLTDMEGVVLVHQVM